ncbi:MAG: serine/threonine-protein kinase [Blastocatellia bacterium]
MKPERWKQIEQIYDAALERDTSRRAAFLDQACEGDEELRREVASLLASDEQAGSFLAAPATEVMAKVIAAEPVSSPIGRRIGHYQVLSLLGAGGMGEVYLAEDKQLGRKIALKLLPTELTTDADRLRRFEQEARTASSLNHPNIITIFEIGQEGPTHYIATEFIDGQTLRQRMESGRTGLGLALDVAAQTAAALAAAHEAGITHRDIKPENVMLRRDGIVKVLDFGLAKLIEPSSPAVDTQAPTMPGASTEAGVVMGTPRYMSPEQARGEKMDARTDIFSLGVMLYEMVAGRTPFAGATTSDVIAAILRDSPPPLAKCAPDTSPELERILSKALRKNRDERYQNADDLLTDLKQLSRDREFTSEEKKRSGQAKAAGGTANQRRLASIVALAGLVIVAVVAWFYFNRSPILTSKDTILLADFDNKTGDAVFDGTLKQALAVHLGQSPFLNICSNERVREALRLMGRSPDERVTPTIGREIWPRPPWRLRPK